MTTKLNTDTRPDARRFAGAVYDDANADIGTNAAGERVARLDLTYGRGTGGVEYTLILSLNAAITLRNMLDGALAAAGVEDGAGPDVAPEDACPNCGERRQDRLVWFENADQVQCEACDHIYAPPRAAETAGQPRSHARSW